MPRPSGRVSTGCSASRVLTLRELHLMAQHARVPPRTFKINRAIRGVTPALSACRRPLHRRLSESEKPTVSPQRSPETGEQVGRLFRRCDVFDWRSFGFGLFAKFIGIVQEPIDQPGAALLHDPRVLGLLPILEDFVISLVA